jgi:hypothetical protein
VRTEPAYGKFSPSIIYSAIIISHDFKANIDGACFSYLGQRGGKHKGMGATQKFIKTAAEAFRRHATYSRNDVGIIFSMSVPKKLLIKLGDT